MDPLSALVALLRPRAVESKVITGAGRWGVRYAAHGHPGFCLVLDGGCWLKVEGAAPVHLEVGDFVLLPATPGFVMASHPDVRPEPATPRHGEEVRHGPADAGVTLRMLGGYFELDPTNASLLGRLLPVMVHIRRGNVRLRRLARLIRAEATHRRPGRELILERLAEVLLVEALRWRATPATQACLLAGLTDGRLAPVLRRMHEDVVRAWTVAELARTAGMSRAVFAEHFTRTVGLAPVEYLRQWRMALARDLLRRQSLPVAAVAQAVGYGSASAFCTAFTRHVGCSPRAFARGSSESGADRPSTSRASR